MDEARVRADFEHAATDVEDAVAAVTGGGAPRWPAGVALLAVAGLYILLPDRLRLGPDWVTLLVVAAVLALLLAAAAVHRLGVHELSRWLAVAGLVVVSVGLLTSTASEVLRDPPTDAHVDTLLRNAALIWAANVLIFSLWYWEIDAGGPLCRRRQDHHSRDFIFPAMAGPLPGVTPGSWSPAFVDYLFLAFNTSTAFSPTDTTILSSRAKLLTMGQSLISLIVIAVLLARAGGTGLGR